MARVAIKKRLGKVYGCKERLIHIYPSGMAALTAALNTIKAIYPNRKTMQIGFPYVDVLKLPQVIFEGGDLILNTDPNYFYYHITIIFHKR